MQPRSSSCGPLQMRGALQRVPTYIKDFILARNQYSWLLVPLKLPCRCQRLPEWELAEEGSRDSGVEDLHGRTLTIILLSLCTAENLPRSPGVPASRHAHRVRVQRRLCSSTTSGRLSRSACKTEQPLNPPDPKPEKP